MKKILNSEQPTTHEVPFSNSNNGYPMYFKKRIDGDIQTIDIAHNKPVIIGELFSCRDGQGIIQIDEILEERKPGKYGKNNHPKGVMFYVIKGEVIEFIN